MCANLAATCIFFQHLGGANVFLFVCIMMSWSIVSFVRRCTWTHTLYVSGCWMHQHQRIWPCLLTLSGMSNIVSCHAAVCQHRSVTNPTYLNFPRLPGTMMFLDISEYCLLSWTSLKKGWSVSSLCIKWAGKWRWGNYNLNQTGKKYFKLLHDSLFN